MKWSTRKLLNLARPDGLLRGLRPLGLAHARLALRATKSPAAICRTRLVVCRRFELQPTSNGNRQTSAEFFAKNARPDGFEPPTTWFEARRNRRIENFEFSKTLIFNDHARGMSVANSPESTTKHHSVTQMSRNHLVCLDEASGI